MDAGLYKGFDKYKLKATVTRSGTGTSAANCQSKWANSSSTVAVGLHAGVAIKPARVDWRVAIPAISVDATFSSIGTPPASSTVELVVQNLRAYRLSTNVWFTYWTSWQFYADGVLKTSGSAGSVTGSLSMMAGIPINGMGATLEATAIGAEKPDVPATDPPPIGFAPETVNAGAVADGGWCFEDDGTWYELPVQMPSYTVPAFTCGQSCSPPVATATTTYNGHIEVWDNMANTTSAASWTISQGSIDLNPNLDKAIYRMNEGYGALWLRTDMPTNSLQVFQSCTSGYSSRSTTMDTASTTLNSGQASMLAFVQNDAHVIEDLFDQTTYCGVHLWATKVRLTTGTGGNRVEYNVTVEAPKMTGSCPSWQSHSIDQAKHANTWCSPHSSYSYHFQDWEVDGSPVGADDYHNPARKQHIHNSALPSEEQTNQLNFIIESPLIDGGGSDWFKTNVVGNSKSWFVGISRYQTVVPTVPSSYTYTSASSSQWSATDCSLSFGASITVTPDSGKTSVVVKLDAGVWTGEPYQLIHICDRIKPNWQLTNVTAVRVYGESADGSTKVLLENTAGDGYTTRNVQYAIPRKTDAKYAGSHAQDNGLGSVTDTGTDLKTAGQSSTVCSDSERVHSFNLLQGGTFAFIRFEIDLSGPVTLEYPIIYPSASAVTVLQENGHHSMLLWPDGPGIRFGQHIWWNGTSLNTTPTVEPLGSAFVSGYHASGLDGLCHKRIYFEGKAATDGLDTEIASLYDSVEGQTRAKLDSFTHSFILPPGDTVGSKAGVISMVNSFSEMPPSCFFPTRARDADYQMTGGFVQEAHSFCQLKRYLVNAGSTPLNLSVDGTVWTAPSSIAVSGWSITEHSHAVGNTETGAKIIGGTQEISSVRPWWGWFFVYAAAVATGDVANVHAALNMFLMAVASGEGVSVRSAKHGDPALGWWKSSAPIADAMSHVCLVSDSRDNAVLLLASDETACYRKKTFDLGATWTTETAMTDTLYERGDESPMLFSTIIGPVESTMKLKAQIRGPHQASYGSAFTVKTSAGPDLVLDDTAIDVHYSKDDEALVLTCKASGETEQGVWLSWDHGKTFKKL